MSRRAHAIVTITMVVCCGFLCSVAVGQGTTAPLPGATATTGVLSGTNLTLVERTVPAGYMELFSAYTESYRDPVVIVEGFDPENDTFPSDVYAMLNTWGGLDMVRAAGKDVWIVNFGDGGGALTANARLVSTAMATAANWGGRTNAKVDVIGLSMGGVIARYALAYDEQHGGGSDGLVRLFVSGDSPQQGANVPPSIQELVLFSQDPTYTAFLNCDAALSMIYTSVRSYESNGCTLGALPSPTNWTGSAAAHNWFYNTLNALNGDGYPHKCRNIAVANGSMSPQPHSVGDPIYTARTYFVFITRIELCNQTYGAYPMDVAPGSPSSDTPGTIREPNFELDEHFPATFIPTESALDIRGGVSKFDRTLLQTLAVSHSTITTDTTDFMLEEALGAERRYNPKYLPDNSKAALYDWVVTAALPGMFYVESTDRLSGLLVISSKTVQEGNSVTVRGSMASAGGERRMIAASVDIGASTRTPAPLLMTNRDVGGSALGSYTLGITGANGLNNIGLLVRTTGKVTELGTDSFCIDDGSGVNLKVSGSGLYLPQKGTKVAVTGISSIEPGASGYQRLLKLRRQEDIVEL
ncbi:MAG: hypothetical protein HYX78_13275 [Armatimonadetes bacterium]|nr:hypothetical protein [Armatimonadota bacterium]